MRLCSDYPIKTISQGRDIPKQDRNLSGVKRSNIFMQQTMGQNHFWDYATKQGVQGSSTVVASQRAGQRAMEMSGFPQVPQQDYHRLSGLHYTSSFSDAEDCCDDLTSTSSSSGYLGMDD
ncbi:hypothetical protein MHYP_G00280010 [Metynnis hypsauchen]